MTFLIIYMETFHSGFQFRRQNAFSSHSVIICTVIHIVPRSYRHGDEVNSDLYTSVGA